MLNLQDRKKDVTQLNSAETTAQPVAADQKITVHVTFVAHARIRPNPYQPPTRLDFTDEQLIELAEDIHRNGLISIPVGRVMLDGNVVMPLLNQADGSGNWSEFLARNPTAYVENHSGHRRSACLEYLFRKYGGERYAHVPMRIEAFDDERMAIGCWSENNQRDDLTAYEEMTQIAQMVEEFGWTHKEAADRLGLNRATVSNKLRLAALPEPLLDQLHRGDISERKAHAILPLYQLPESAAAAIEDAGGAGYYEQPTRAAIIKNITDLTSDTIREKVRQIEKRATQPLDGEAFDPYAAIGTPEEDGVRQSACAGCLSSVNGGKGKPNRCADISCFTIKAEISATLLVEAAAASISLPVIQAGATVQTFYGSDAAVAREKMQSPACEHIGVQSRGWGGVEVDSHPGHYVVCQRKGGCACVKAAEKAAKQADPTEGQKKLLNSAVRQPATKALKAAMTASISNPDLWAAVLNHQHYRPDESFDKLVAGVVNGSLDRMLKYDSHKDVYGTQQALRTTFSQIGVSAEFPTLDTEHHINHLRRRLDKISRWLSNGALWGLPDTETLQAHQDSLIALIAALEPLNDQLQVEDEIKLALRHQEVIHAVATFAENNEDADLAPTHTLQTIIAGDVLSDEYIDCIANTTPDTLKYARLFANSETDSDRLADLDTRIRELELASKALPSLLPTIASLETLSGSQHSAEIILLLTQRGFIADDGTEQSVYTVNSDAINAAIS